MDNSFQLQRLPGLASLLPIWAWLREVQALDISLSSPHVNLVDERKSPMKQHLDELVTWVRALQEAVEEACYQGLE
jgi:hypothetical protein